MKTCCIISKTPPSWSEFEGSHRYDLWADEIDKLVYSLNKDGVNRFITCMNRGAETVFAAAVLNLKSQKLGVRLEAALPFEEQARDWSEAERDRYFDIIERCDSENMVSTRYSLAAEEACYKYMISNSDVVIISEGTRKKLSHLINSKEFQNKRYIYI